MDDETVGVRAAGVRVGGVTGEAEHADDVRQALDDPEPEVAEAAARRRRFCLGQTILLSSTWSPRPATERDAEWLADLRAVAMRPDL